MRPADTSPEAWEVFIELVRKMPPEEKARHALELSERVRLVGEAGLREKYPNASEREIFLRSARGRLGKDLFRKVYGNELPDDGTA